MNENEEFEKERTEQRLIRLAANLGRMRFLMLGIIASLFLLPPVAAVFMVICLWVFDSEAIRKRAEEVGPLVRSLLEVMKPEDVEDLLLELRSERVRDEPSVQLAEKVEREIEKGRRSITCFDGHTLGCRHRPIQERPSWPEILQEAVRKGNDALPRTVQP